MEHSKERIENYKTQIKTYAELTGKLQEKNWDLVCKNAQLKSSIKAQQLVDMTNEKLIELYEKKIALLEEENKMLKEFVKYGK